MKNVVLYKESMFNEIISLVHNFIPNIMPLIKKKVNNFKKMEDLLNIQEIINDNLVSVCNSSDEYELLLNYFNTAFKKLFNQFINTTESQQNSKIDIYSHVQSINNETLECEQLALTQINSMKRIFDSSKAYLHQIQKNELEKIIENTTYQKATKNHKIEQREFLDLSSVIDSQNLTISKLYNELRNST